MVLLFSKYEYFPQLKISAMKKKLVKHRFSTSTESYCHVHYEKYCHCLI